MIPSVYLPLGELTFAQNGFETRVYLAPGQGTWGVTIGTGSVSALVTSGDVCAYDSTGGIRPFTSGDTLIAGIVPLVHDRQGLTTWGNGFAAPLCTRGRIVVRLSGTFVPHASIYALPGGSVTC